MKKFRRIISILISVVMIVSMMAVGSFADDKNKTDIVILATSDVHCQVDQVKDKNGNITNIGYAGLSGYRTAMEAQYENVSLVDNGDAMQGYPIGALTKGESVAEILAAVNYDVLTPGNHEFDYTAAHFINNLAIWKSSLKYYSCTLKKDGALVFEPYKMITYNVGDPSTEVKVAYIGITTPETMVASNPANFIEDGKNPYDFCADNYYEQVQNTIDAARGAGAKYIVALGHTGNARGESNPYSSTSTIENTRGISVYIDGHDHRPYDVNEVNDKDGKPVKCVGSSTELRCIDKIVIENAVGEGTITVSEVKPAEAATEDAAVKEAVTRQLEIIDEKTKQPIGDCKIDLIAKNPDGTWAARERETNLGDFVADAYRTIADADIGLVNGGGLRNDIKKGVVKFGDIIAVNPFSNKICVCEATGQNILDCLEYGAMSAGKEAFAGFMQVSGLTYKIDTSIPSTVMIGENKEFLGVSGERRVYGVKVAGVPIDSDKTYTVASHNFLIKNGGDGFIMFKNNKLVRDEFKLDNEVLIDYVTKNLNGKIGEQYAEPQGRIVFAKKPVTPQKPVETGDQTNVLPFVLCAAAALILIILLIIVKKKK